MMNAPPPPNLATPGADRAQALKEAKAAAGVPPDAEPDVQPNYGKNPTPDSKAQKGSENLVYDNG